MLRTSNLAKRLVGEVHQFSPESKVIGYGRSLLALAQLTVLVVTPSTYLFVPVYGQPQAPHCEGIRKATAYCLAPDGLSLQTTSVVVIAGLIVVASGYRPRWTAPLHWWLTISIATGIALPDGGEAVAQNVTFLLIFLCANDRRRWHWQAPTGPIAAERALNGVSYVAHWAIRVQMAYVYMNSAVAKIGVEEWGNGTALFYILRGENFGTAAPWAGPLLWLSGTALGALSLAWGTILAEALLSLLLLGRPTAQRLAWWVCVMLHGGIALFLGLWSFGMIMIASVTLATFRGLRGAAERLPTSDSPQVSTTRTQGSRQRSASSLAADGF